MRKFRLLPHSLLITSIILVLLVAFVKYQYDTQPMTEEEQVVEEDKQEYGITVNGYYIIDDIIKSGENLSTILSRFGVSAATVDSLVKCSQGIFDLRTIRSDHGYKAFMSGDSTNQRLCHFVYEKNLVDYVVFSFEDSLSVRTDSKEIRQERRVAEAVINSSLYNAMVDQGLSAGLAMDLSDIYAWSIDFFGLQKGDNFKVIYEEQFVDTTSVGIGAIMGAVFESSGKKYYAIPFEQSGKLSYWDENGNSLRKALLKAPLKFSRISSRFSNSRLHPVLRIRRPHHGVDYAAPSGTPVYSVADGVIIAKGYSGGGGNTIKIRHSGGLMSGYLHLKGYAKGISNGSRVSQGDLIGYVGSTGLSTGAHLDFRIWKNGTPIDPLKVPSEPAEPIKATNKENFALVKEMVLGGLEGKYSIDSIDIYKQSVPVITINQSINAVQR